MTTRLNKQAVSIKRIHKKVRNICACGGLHNTSEAQTTIFGFDKSNLL